MELAINEETKNQNAIAINEAADSSPFVQKRLYTKDGKLIAISRWNLLRRAWNWKYSTKLSDIDEAVNLTFDRAFASSRQRNGLGYFDQRKLVLLRGYYQEEDKRLGRWEIDYFASAMSYLVPSKISVRIVTAPMKIPESVPAPSVSEKPQNTLNISMGRKNGRPVSKAIPISQPKRKKQEPARRAIAVPFRITNPDSLISIESGENSLVSHESIATQPREAAKEPGSDHLDNLLHSAMFMLTGEKRGQSPVSSSSPVMQSSSSSSSQASDENSPGSPTSMESLEDASSAPPKFSGFIQMQALEYFDQAYQLSDLKNQGLTDVAIAELRLEIGKKFTSVNLHTRAQQKIHELVTDAIKKQPVKDFNDKWVSRLRTEYHLTDGEISVVRNGYLEPRENLDEWVETRAEKLVEERNLRLWAIPNAGEISLGASVESNFGLSDQVLSKHSFNDVLNNRKKIRDPKQFKKAVETDSRSIAIMEYTTGFESRAKKLYEDIGLKSDQLRLLPDDFSQFFDLDISSKERPFDKDGNPHFGKSAKMFLIGEVLFELVKQPQLAPAQKFYVEMQPQDLQSIYTNGFASLGEKLKELPFEQWAGAINQFINHHLLKIWAIDADDATIRKLFKSQRKLAVTQAVEICIPYINWDKVNNGEISLLSYANEIREKVPKTALNMQLPLL